MAIPHKPPVIRKQENKALFILEFFLFFHIFELKIWMTCLGDILLHFGGIYFIKSISRGGI